MVNWNSLKLRDTLVFINLLLLLILINIVSQFFFLRIDLTEEKRYSLKNTTKAYIQELQEPVFIEVYLTGELNPAFTRLKKSIEEIGEEFRLASNNTITIHFTDPSQAKGEKARNEFMADLAARGVQPRNIIETVNGKRQEKIVFPGAIVSASGLETGVNFLKGNAAAGSEEVINQSIEGLEYEFVSAKRMERTTADGRVRVAGLDLSDMTIGASVDMMRATVKGAGDPQVEWIREGA